MAPVRAKMNSTKIKQTSDVNNNTNLPSLFTISIICIIAQSNYHKANCLPIDSSRG